MKGFLLEPKARISLQVNGQTMWDSNKKASVYNLILLDNKMNNKDFLIDINPLITDIEKYNVHKAYLLVKKELLELL